jgi:uncharacterized membrane protein YdcZ (DUF606 family)
VALLAAGGAILSAQLAFQGTLSAHPSPVIMPASFLLGFYCSTTLLLLLNSEEKIHRA